MISYQILWFEIIRIAVPKMNYVPIFPAQRWNKPLWPEYADRGSLAAWVGLNPQCSSSRWTSVPRCLTSLKYAPLAKNTMWRPFHTHPCPCPCRVKGNPALEQNVGRCTRRSAFPAWDSKLCVMLAMTVMLLMLGWWWWWWWSWCYDDDQPSSPLAPLPLSLSTPPLLDNNQHIGLYYISIVNYRWLKNRNSNNNKDRLVVQ